MHRLKQRDAAKLLGVSPVQLMLWEQGKRMPIGKNLYKLGALYHALNEDIYFELRQEAVAEVAENMSKYGEGIGGIHIRSP
ncbi:hypothetical protein GCM10023093_07340 [Nemorincola caseinilytica]|uniref:HTH cro/C1-type domain-containing protein n=2 Tax=Nemorincola caseinilytica TaxID=2054315 RepID=A0ABP8N8Y5_9BACT